MGKALGRHRGWKSLGHSHRLHDPILDGDYQSLLLLKIGSDAQGGEKLPHVNVLPRVNRAGEYVRKAWLNTVEKGVVKSHPEKKSQLLRRQ